MRYSVVRFRASAILASLALAGTCLSGCGRFNPSGENAALLLLKEGSEKVCTEPSVQATLRSALLPKPTEIQIGNDDDKRAALAAVTFSYSLTTLESFDKATNKASCATTLEVHGPANSSNQFHILYTISPSADDPNATVVSTEDSDARAYILSSVVSSTPGLDNRPDHLMEMEENSEDTAAPSVDEASLAGVWIKTRQPGAACHGGSAVAFQPDHVITGGLGKGRWALTGNALHLVTDASRTSDVTANILAADVISMTLEMPGNSRLTLRRCSSDELQAPPAPPAEQPAGTAPDTNGAPQ